MHHGSGSLTVDATRIVYTHHLWHELDGNLSYNMLIQREINRSDNTLSRFFHKMMYLHHIDIVGRFTTRFDHTFATQTL